ITSTLIASYDESIDLRPRTSGVVGLIWTVPVIVMVFGFAGLAAVFRKWRLAPERSASEEDAELVARLRNDRS
ncbi:MAG: cytochrome c-type biogenesis protein CcmH, partial [Acidimicrobiales bacterium]